MINQDQHHLMFIEPKLPPEPPIDDEITNAAKLILERCREGTRWRGFHVCSCGARSGNVDLHAGSMLTNSLLVHYVERHRSEIPLIEILKLGIAAGIML